MRTGEQELMTPREAARWFRRSLSWLRARREILRFGSETGNPRYHLLACRAYVLGALCGLDGEALRRVQLEAVASACGFPDKRRVAALTGMEGGADPDGEQAGAMIGAGATHPGRISRNRP